MARRRRRWHSGSDGSDVEYAPAARDREPVYRRHPPQHTIERTKYSANREASILDAPIVEGKRKRREVQAYTDQGADTRKAAQSMTQEGIADPRDRGNREKNGRWTSAILDKRTAPFVAKVKEDRHAKQEAAIRDIVDLADKLWIDKSWQDRKEDCFLAFARAVDTRRG